jgi:hypothetical protein
MANGIDIVIGGEVSGALAAMTAVEQRTIVLQSRIAKLQQVAGTTQNIEKLNKSLQLLGKTQSELGRLSGAGSFSGVTKGSNEATASLINLSRVAQDAPYGFIGIANNINPLLESFQRLKASTGTTGGALKALGSSLLGGGGLGLAVGVVSSLFVVFGDKLFGSSKKAKEANEEYERLNKVIKEVSRSAAEVSAAGAASTVDERARVSILANAVRDQTKSYNERNNALNQLKEINKNYFGDLTLETASLATLTARVDEYSKALISAAIVKEFSSDIAKTAVETSKAGQKYNQLSDDVETLNNKLRSTVKFQTESISAGSGNTVRVQSQTKEYTKLALQLDEANNALFEQGQILSKLDDISTSARNGLSKAIEDGLKLKPLTSTGIKVNADKVEVKPKSVVIDFNQGVSDKQIADLTKYMFDKSVKFDFIAPELIPPEEAKQQGLTFSQMFGHEVEKYFKQTDPIDFGLNKAVREFKPPKTFSFKMFEGLSEEQFKLAESAELITNTLAPAFDNLINAIGRGENAFQAFGEGVKQVLVQVISKLVQTALLAAALSLIPGGVGGVKGFGAIFSSLLGFGGARASGGPVSFGKSYLVGENGPELFVPSNSGSIMNGNQVAAMSYSGGGSSSGGRQIIRGQNIILSYARTNRAQNRLGRG